jgi:hypothetical protein
MVTVMNKSSRGAALIMVLFIAAILGSVAVLLIVKTKQHIQRVTIAKEFMQAERDLITDLNHLIFNTQTSPYTIMGDSSAFAFPKSSLPESINLQNTPFTYRKSQFSIQDMGGLIPINPLDSALVTRYLTQINWPNDQIYRFLDVLADWQDTDGFQRVNGAETNKYSVYGYPLNQLIQSVKELGLLAKVDPVLLNNLATDKNLMLYSAGRETLDYTPDQLLSVFHSDFDASKLQLARDKSRQSNEKILVNNYSSGNWIIKVNTGYRQAKSSKILHLLRRFGERRPFVISHWQDRPK